MKPSLWNEKVTNEPEHSSEETCLYNSFRGVKRSYRNRMIHRQSDWSKVGEGFQGCSTDANDSPLKSQASIQWDFSDKEQSSDSDTDCFGQIRAGKSHSENSPDRTSEPDVSKSQKKSDTPFWSPKSLFVDANTPVKNEIEDENHLMDINVIQSPVQKKKSQENVQIIKKLRFMGNSSSQTDKINNSGCIISQYESDSEESDVPRQSLDQECYSPTNCRFGLNDEETPSPVISPSPDLSKRQRIETTKRIKAGDWAISVQKILDAENDSAERSRPKPCQNEANQILPSGKDAPQVRQNLAERIQMLVEREKSYYSSWSPKATKKSQDDHQKILVVKVNKKEVKYSLLECNCTCLSDQSALLDTGDDVKDLNLKVLFHMELDKTIRLGALIKVHPPWQKMSASKAGVMVLCTHYPEIIGYEAPEEYKTLREEDITWQEVASWQCPCRTDSSVDARVCCAQVHTKVEQMLQDNFEGTEAVSSGDTSNVSTTDDRTSHTSNILSSIECQEASGISFTAMVQRVFCRYLSNKRFSRLSPLKKDSVQYGLLVQDQRGTLCEIQLPECCTDLSDWAEVILRGEGAVFKFTQLRIIQRTNPAKHRALFSMLNKLWQDGGGSRMDNHNRLNSQSEDTSPDTNNPGPPSFCYQLKCDVGVSHCCRSSLEIETMFCPVFLVDFPHSVNSTTGKRCSFLAKVLTQWRKSVEDKSDGMVLQIMDNNGHIFPAFLENGFHQEYEVMSLPCTILIRDTFVNGGRITLDAYSKIIPANLACHKCFATEEQVLELQNTSFSIPKLDDRSDLFSLVSIEGVIVGVDESTAYSWFACSFCNNDRLAGGTDKNPDFHCNQCNKPVTNPTMKFSLEVIVDAAPRGIGKVKLKLLQDSIQKLLPPNTEGGCDVEAILMKPIGPLPAIIVSREFTQSQRGYPPIFHAEEACIVW